MIKTIITIALIAGGVFAFNVLQQIHEDNPRILDELDQAWEEVTSGNSSGAFEYSNQVRTPPRRLNFSSSAYVRDPSIRSNAKPDVGAQPWRPNRNTQPARYNRNQTDDLATAYKLWRTAVMEYQAAMRASRNGGHDAACRAALQEVYTTKYHYDTLKARAHAASRRR
jgi:hypothetical protein